MGINWFVPCTAIICTSDTGNTKIAVHYGHTYIATPHSSLLFRNAQDKWQAPSAMTLYTLTVSHGFCTNFLL